MSYRPPFTLTPLIFSLSQKIYLCLGMISGKFLELPSLQLRRQNQIKTLHASLAIEGNTLTLDQITALLAGKPVIGSSKEIQEVRNASLIYDEFDQLDPLSMENFLYAHGILMKDLAEKSGQWRQSDVGIFKGTHLTHMAPPAHRVPGLMAPLFEFMREEKEELSWLIKACIFHYELEFIHPFSDGNGRMGRLWQHLLLSKENPVFRYISVEEMIRESQEEYYEVLGKCDQQGNSTLFIEYALKQILKALERYKDLAYPLTTIPRGRLEYAQSRLLSQQFSRKEYASIFKNISTATASRDLAFGVQQKILTKTGLYNQARYQFRGGEEK